MKGRALGWVLLVLVSLVAGGLWWRVHLLREAKQRYEVERLTGLPVAAPVDAPAAAAAPGPQAPAVPVQVLTPVLGGTVLRLADESPLDGAVVEVLGATKPDGQPEVLCHTNTVGDGRFVFTAPGLQPTALRVWYPVGYPPAQRPPPGHPGYHVSECVVQTVPLSAEEARRLDLTLKVDTGWVLWGTVGDTSGQLITGGVVTLLEPHAYSVVDPQGQYRIRDLPPDGKALSLMATGLRVRGATIEMPAPAPDQRLVRFDIQLTPAGLIFGKVEWRRSTPRPVMPPVITVVNPAGPAAGPEALRPANVDAAGNFQLDGLPAGRWDLSCAWSTVEGETQRTYSVYARGIDVEVGATIRQDFLLPGDAALELQVNGAAGAPLPGLRVELCHVLDPSAAGTPVLSEVFGVTGADGRCAFADLAPGAKEVRVMTQPELRPGVAPEMPERLATQRLDVAVGSNAATVVVEGR